MASYFKHHISHMLLCKSLAASAAFSVFVGINSYPIIIEMLLILAAQYLSSTVNIACCLNFKANPRKSIKMNFRLIDWGICIIIQEIL